MKITNPKCVGISRDQRTNVWLVQCPCCGNTFKPQTTRLSQQNFSCPGKKCGKELFADYNAEPPFVRESIGVNS